jgi:hypothetical protein
MRRSGDIAIFSSRSPALAWLSVSGTSGSNPLSSSAESGANLALDRGAGSVPDSGTTPAVVADPDDELHGLPLDIPAGVREE